MSDEEIKKYDTENEAVTDTSEVPDTSELPDTTATPTSEDDDDLYTKKEDVDYTFSPIDLITTIYQNRYYWDIFKSTIMFLVALKMAKECRMLRIPMKEYKPFNRCNHFF